MSDETQLLPKAKEAINELFGHMNITRVVYVDDRYHEIELDEIFILCKPLNSEQIKSITELQDIADSKDKDDELFKEDLETKWGSLTPTQIRNIHQDLKKIENVDVDIEADYKSIGLLGSILKDHSLKAFSFTQWQQEKNNLFEENTTSKSLFLFDQDMTEEGGRKDEGINQIVQLCNDQRDDLLFGILSNIGSIDDEIEIWESLAVEHKLPKEKFIYIHKQRLQNPLSFARMVKLAAISGDCQQLKICAKDLYRTALDKAHDEIDKINIYDFEHIVFEHSHAEGTWEPEMLFRMFNHYHKKSLNHLAKQNPDLLELTQKIRPISSIPVPEKGTEKPTHNTLEYQRNELYEDVSFINSFHLPIELGDIFQKTTGSKQYVLIGHPCDLMIRPEGKRSVETAILAEIQTKTNEQLEKGQIPIYAEELMYYCEDRQKKAFVMFNRSSNIQLSVLDYCVFQIDGQSRFKCDAPPPQGLLSSWIKLYMNEQEKLKNALKKVNLLNKVSIEELPKSEKKMIHSELLPKASNSGFLKPTLNGKQLEYPIKRVGRISAKKASAILTSYSYFLSRAAFDRDLGKDIL